MKHRRSHWAKLYKRAKSKQIKLTKIMANLMSESNPDLNRLENIMTRREKYHDEAIDIYYDYLK